MAGHRIARRLRLVPPASVWIGIDLGQERHAVAVLSPDGQLLARSAQGIQTPDLDYVLMLREAHEACKPQTRERS